MKLFQIINFVSAGEIEIICSKRNIRWLRLKLMGRRRIFRGHSWGRGGIFDEGALRKEKRKGGTEDNETAGLRAGIVSKFIAV